MRSNFDDDFCPNTVTKKFWSSIKLITKSTRIPDKMHLNDCIRSDPEQIANLFNKHFCDQFSDDSLYDIEILTSQMTLFMTLTSMNLQYLMLLSKLTPIKVEVLTILEVLLLKTVPNR